MRSSREKPAGLRLRSKGPQNTVIMSRASLYCLCGGVASGLLLFAAFMLIGSDMLVAGQLCAAWTVAWMAVAVGGGFRTVTSWFAFFPLFHFLLFSLPFKVIFWEAAEERLGAPFSTSLVLLLFFTGLLFATFVSQCISFRSWTVCSKSTNPEFFRILAWICFLLGTLAYFIFQFGQTSDSSAGGAGIMGFFMNFKDFSVAAYIFYAWRTGLQVWRRPAFWLFIVTGVLLGILASAKGAVSQPIVYALLATCCIHGFRSFKMLIGIAAFGAILATTIYPLMHYARGVEGARTGTLAQRAAIMGTVTSTYLTNPNARAGIKEQVDDYATDRSVMYLPKSTGLFDRFLMIGPTDLLVSGVDQSSANEKFHGFELFRSALELSIPRFLYPQKPEVGSSEFLADIAGTRNTVQRTNPTWGIPSQLYYSFGFLGVLIGSFFIELIFLLLIKVWFGNQVGKSLWFCLLALTLNMYNSCAGIDSMPFALISLLGTALLFSKAALFLSRRVRTSAAAS
jgi:hypothetical protein